MITSNRKKPGVAFWATVALVVVLLAYPLSFGPACWLTQRDLIPVAWTARIYRPLVNYAIDRQSLARRMLRGYAELYAPPIKFFVGSGLVGSKPNMSIGILESLLREIN